MKWCICVYDYAGKLKDCRRYSCAGCGWRQAPKDVPVCMRKSGPTGEIVKKNPHFVTIEKKIK